MAKPKFSKLANVMKEAREVPLPALSAPDTARPAKSSGSIAPGRPTAGRSGAALSQFGFVLDPEDHRALKRKAFEEDRPASEIVRDLIREYVRRP